MRRSAKLFLATNGSSANPGHIKRCRAITSGDSPEVTPWRAATKPKAQNRAAPAPQATPHAVAYFAASGKGFFIRLGPRLKPKFALVCRKISGRRQEAQAPRWRRHGRRRAA